MNAEVWTRYQHPEHGELLVKAWVSSKGDIRIHKIREVPNGRYIGLRYRKGTYIVSGFMRYVQGGTIEVWMCDLANSGVFSASLLAECRALAKLYGKAADKLGEASAREVETGRRG